MFQNIPKNEPPISGHFGGQRLTNLSKLNGMFRVKILPIVVYEELGIKWDALYIRVV